MDMFIGRITSTSFATGDRIVIGDWEESPLGSFTNVMWARKDGKRILISPSKKCAEYVSKIYSFEEVRICPIEVIREDKKLQVKGPNLVLNMEWGRSLMIPIKRPRWFISTIECIVGNLIFGSKTYGKTRDGRKEWYMIKGISKVSKAYGEYNGETFGSMEKNLNPSLFGFSEPPKIPSSVLVNSIIEKN